MSTRILIGDCRAVLPTLEAGSVQCCVTSPPYFGLRSYLDAGHADKAQEIGAETTPDAYVAELVAVFREVRRVLRDNGVVWLNIGDSYAATGKSGGGAQGARWDAHGAQAIGPRGGKWSPAPAGFKPKDLLMIPARVALALQADGWFLRSDVIWHKPNPMPESVNDRPTSAHEHVFLLSKRHRYFYDAEAIREPDSGQDHRRGVVEAIDTSDGHLGPHKGIRTVLGRNGLGRNSRNVWTIATAPYSGAHFATMPPELAERCIKAGSKPGDAILDPFSGAGTTALVADRLGRHGIGIELNPGYSALASNRVSNDSPLFAEVSCA